MLQWSSYFSYDDWRESLLALITFSHEPLFSVIFKRMWIRDKGDGQAEFEVYIYLQKGCIIISRVVSSCVADNSNHNINNGVGPLAAATLVTDQVVLVLQCSALDSELKMMKVMHIYPPDRDRATPAMCRQYEVHATPPLLQILSHHNRSQGLIYWTLLPQAPGISCNLQLSLCHPSFRLCWSPLSSVKHACITVLPISTSIAICTLLNTSYFMAWHYHHKPES